MRTKRRGKVTPRATDLPWFQPGYDMVVRRGSRAFVVRGDGCPLDQEVAGDFIDEPFRDRVRCAQPSALPLLRMRVQADAALSLEGIRERVAFIDGLIAQYRAANAYTPMSVPICRWSAAVLVSERAFDAAQEATA